MNALIVYDSRFGNTERIARAIAEALECRSVGVGDVAPADVEGVDLLLVGGPTQVHGVSPALRAFLAGLPAHALQDVPAAAFDTRFPKARALTGSAAAGLARRLGRKGARLVAPPESFFVTDMEGPLVEGELERAAGWARGLREKAGLPAGRPLRVSSAPPPPQGTLRCAAAHFFPLPILTIRADSGRMGQRVTPAETEDEEKRSGAPY